MESEIKKRIDKYQKLTSHALTKATKSIIKGKEREARDIIEMVENYLSDSKYFKEKRDFLNAFAAINYAHGWLDCGVKIGVFNVKDHTLFTIK